MCSSDLGLLDVVRRFLDRTGFPRAQKIAMLRNRSRSRRPGRVGGDATNEPYVLRSYITCMQCERRMFGKNDGGRIYYVCSPKRSHLPEGHPAVTRRPVRPGFARSMTRVAKYSASRSCSLV